MAASILYALFFLSGASGLIYQVVWVRQFGNLFGNTIHSAAIVSGVFLCGLGVGAWLTGRWTDRRWQADRSSPLRAYAGFEMAIAGMGLAIALILPALEPLSSSISSYRVAADGWHQLDAASWALRYGIALLLLAPITLPMGGTLVLLIRYLVPPEVSRSGWRIGTLYGVNTAGAACGAFLTDFALIPSLGIFATEGVAVALNAAAGLGALALARWRISPGPVPNAPQQLEAERASPSGGPSELRWTALALFCSGVMAMGIQILWFRYLCGVLGSYRSVFSLLLSVILVGLWLGSTLGGFAARRPAGAARLYVLAQALVVATTLATLALFGEALAGGLPDAFAESWSAASVTGRRLIELWLDLAPILCLVGAPALLMGFAFPLANAHVQRLQDQVGSRAGLLYLANTFGNVSGSLLAGFVLLPLCGIQNSAGVLAGFGVLSVLALSRSVELAVPRRAFAFAMVSLAAAVGGWSLLPPDVLLAPSVPRHFAPKQRVLAVGEGIHETVAVIEVPGVERRLFTNGHSMSSSHRFAQRYMRLFAHVPLLQMDDPRRVLVICFGVGNTLHAASLHPSVERLEVVDLSRNVLRQASWFAGSNGGVLDDPRVQVFVNDGRQHLRMQASGSYDLVTLEPPPIATAGVASLYSVEFYRLVRSRLREGGALTQWLPGYQVDGPAALAVVRAFLEVFPNAVMLSGYHNELILLGTKGGSGQVDPDEVRRRRRARPAVRADLRRIDVETPSAFFGSFVADARTLARATQDTRPVTDDHPVMEYSVRSRLFETRMPASLFDVSGIRSWCPRCFRGAEPHPRLTQLPGHLAALEPWYASEQFLVHRSNEAGSFLPDVRAPDDPEIVAAVRASRYLRRFVRLPAPPLSVSRAAPR